MRTPSLLATAALALAGLLATPAQAGWLGSQVTGSFALVQPLANGTVITQPFPAGPVAVGPGVEFFGTFFNPDSLASFRGDISLSLDLDDTGFSLGVSSALGGYNGFRGFPIVTLSVSGLPGAGALAPTDWTCSSAGLSCSVNATRRYVTAGFDDQGVLQIAMNGLRAGETYRFDLVPQASVPAPAGVALFALGLLGLTALRRTAA